MSIVFAASNDLSFWGGEATASYKLLFIVHIVAVVVAFGPLFVAAAINREALARKGEAAQAFAKIPLQSSLVSLPALLVAAVAGMLLIADSQKRYAFEQTWVSISFTVVIVVALVIAFVLRPAQRSLMNAVAHEAESAERTTTIQKAKAKVAMATGIVHLGLVVLVALMVWKPGL